VLALATAGLVAGAPSAGAASQTFTTSSPSFAFTVPASVCSLRIDAVGASGAAINGTAGGTGGEVLATIAVQPGQQLNIVLGHVGGPAFFAGSGFATGGNGGDGIRLSGGGGGSTAVTLSGSPVVIAGAGGGAAGDAQAGGTGGDGNTAIAGTAASGGNGVAGMGSFPPPGQGGQNTGAGGTGGFGPASNGGSAPDGTGGTGGNGQAPVPEWGGGGGGAGYSGGGGGSGSRSDLAIEAGSGGGGASWANPAFAPSNIVFPTTVPSQVDGTVTLTWSSDPNCATAAVTVGPRFTG
jgi:hypothetical protein